MDYIKLGKILQEARNQVGMKQSDIADKVNCTPANISSWERGKSKIDIDSLATLCEIYNIDFVSTLDNVVNDSNSEGNNLALEANEKAMIIKYRSLDPYGQEAINTILDVEYKRCSETDTSGKILSLTAARSVNNDEPVAEEYVKDLSKIEPDDSDL